MALSGDSSEVCFPITLGLWVWGRKTRGKMPRLSRAAQGTCWQHDLPQWVLTDSLAKGLSVRFLLWSDPSSPPFPYCPLWKEAAAHGPRFRREDL